MFWGLAIEPGKRYMQTVAKSFHLSMACLELSNNDEAVALMLDYEGQEYVLCNLHKQKAMQCPLDLNFEAGEKIAFYSAGRSRVHLSGFLVEEDTELSEEEVDEEEVEEVSEASPIKKSPGKKRKDDAKDLSGNKKFKMQAPESEDDDDDDDDDDDTFEGLLEEEEEDEEGGEEEEEDDDSDDQLPTKILNKSQQNKTPSEKQKKKEVSGQSPKTPNQQNGQVQTPQTGKKNKNKQGNDTPKQGTPQSGSPQKRVLQGGVLVQDTKVGNGPVAKSGKEVSVYYVGRLKSNNKQFDSATSGPGFKFNLGRSEVIKGWDIGVAGMRVGGKRTITCPPQMAYGKKGQPPVIPPNSVLIFDVELKHTN